MKQTMRIILGSFLVTTALIKATPVLAKSRAPAMNVSIVRTVDLDLSTDAGLRQLNHRLANAAREVCGTASDADLVGKNHARTCRDEVLTQVEAQRDRLIASARSGEPIAVTAAR